MGHMEQVLRRAGVTGIDSLGTQPASDFRVPTTPVPMSELPAVTVAPPPAYARGPVRDAADLELLLTTGTLHAAAVEQYRSLAVTLHRARQDRGIRTIAVTSALAAEGKTLTCANLALTLADSYAQSVLLVEADLRRPRLHELFGAAPADGLRRALVDGHTSGVQVHAVSPRLSLVLAGGNDLDPMQLFARTTMRELIKEWETQYDWILIDTPPATLFPDAALMSASVDAWLMVIRAGHAPFARLQQAIGAIGRERLVGAILNRAEGGALPAEEYDRYYGDGHGG